MTGLLVIGVVHGAGEDAVAAALAGALGGEAVVAVALGDRDADAVYAFPGVGDPAIAGQHVGTAIDPAALVDDLQSLGDGAVVAVGGGLFGALTARYTTRDLARDLGLPLVLVAPVGPDATHLTRLATAAARASGLTVAGAVLTGWPGQPDRMQLDERRLLEEHVRVATQPGSALPAQEWAATAAQPPGRSPASGGDAPPPALAHPLAAAAAPAPSGGQAFAGAGDVELEPYEAWEARPVGDPRATPRPRIMEAMLEIIAVEGPMRATRAYALYNRASGGKKLTTIARAPLSSAVYWLSNERKVTLTKAADIPWQDDDLLRLPDAPAVRVRELGPRTLEEVPLDEIAELMRRLRSAGYGDDEAALKREVLNRYGLKRLTTKADEYLGLAYGLST